MPKDDIPSREKVINQIATILKNLEWYGWEQQAKQITDVIFYPLVKENKKLRKELEKLKNA